jgi:hypothetical protein
MRHTDSPGLENNQFYTDTQFAKHFDTMPYIFLLFFSQKCWNSVLSSVILGMTLKDFVEIPKSISYSRLKSVTFSHSQNCERVSLM